MIHYVHQQVPNFFCLLFGTGEVVNSSLAERDENELKQQSCGL